MCLNRNLSIVLLISLAITAVNVSAEQSYSYRLLPQYQALSFEGDGDGEVKSLSAAVYFEPVNQTAPYPYASSAHYQRAGFASLSYADISVDGLSMVQGGRVLKAFELEERSLAVHLAEAKSPLWLSLAYYSPSDIEFTFTSQDLSLDRDDVWSVQLGNYLDDFTSVGIGYQKGDSKAWNLEARQLIPFSEGQFFELYAFYQKLKSDDVEIEMVSNTIRNAAGVELNRDSWALGLSYSPVRSLSFSYRYQRDELDQDKDQKVQYFSLEYWPLSSLSLSAQYETRKRDEYTGDAFDSLESTLALAMGYHF